jgi:prepilin-type N-terminal cleavage/methylation domain-containing protein/prepilin-type processing-associated H-X9-DG protein
MIARCAFSRYAVARCAFTLIELLIVVMIILILLAMILPMGSTIRYSAGKVVCASNLRQIGMGLMAYSSDFSQYLPSPTGNHWNYSPGGNGSVGPYNQYADWTHPTWDRVLAPYINEVNDTENPWAAAAADQPPPTSLRVKVYRCGLDKAPDCQGMQRRSYLFNDGCRPNFDVSGRPFRLSNVLPWYADSPAGVCLLSDYYNVASSYDNTLGWSGGSYAQEWGYAPWFAHPRGDMNMLYMDFHVANFNNWANVATPTAYSVANDPP